LTHNSHIHIYHNITYNNARLYAYTQIHTSYTTHLNNAGNTTFTNMNKYPTAHNIIIYHLQNISNMYHTTKKTGGPCHKHNPCQTGAHTHNADTQRTQLSTTTTKINTLLTQFQKPTHTQKKFEYATWETTNKSKSGGRRHKIGFSTLIIKLNQQSLLLLLLLLQAVVLFSFLSFVRSSSSLFFLLFLSANNYSMLMALNIYFITTTRTQNLHNSQIVNIILQKFRLSIEAFYICHCSCCRWAQLT